MIDSSVRGTSSPASRTSPASDWSLASTLAVVTAALAAGLGILEFLLFTGDDGSLVVAFVLAPVLVLFSICWSVVAWFLSRRRGRRLAWKSNVVAVALLAIAWWAVLTMPIPARRALAWCERAIPILDDYRARNGRYPQTLDEVDLTPGASMARIKYGVFGDGFFLAIVDPHDWGGWHFYSTQRTWRRST